MKKSTINSIIIVLVCLICMGNGNIVKANVIKHIIVSIYKEADEIDKLIEESNLSSIYKDELVRLKEKIHNDIVLTQEEVDFIRECRIEIIKDKLGEELFKRYCQLIEIREGDGEFTQEQRYELYEIEKILK